MFRLQNYETMTPEKRPQDFNLDGAGWTYRTMEHGGEYCDSMPQAILATDPDGRSCVYVPITVNGKVVNSKGFGFDSRPGTSLSHHSCDECSETIVLATGSKYCPKCGARLRQKGEPK